MQSGDLKVLVVMIDETNSILGYTVQRADGSQINCSREQMLTAEQFGHSFVNATIFDRGDSKVIKVDRNVPRVPIYKQKPQNQSKNNQVKPLSNKKPAKYQQNSLAYVEDYKVQLPKSKEVVYIVNSVNGVQYILAESERNQLIKKGLMQHKNTRSRDFKRDFIPSGIWSDNAVLTSVNAQNILRSYIPDIDSTCNSGSPTDTL